MGVSDNQPAETHCHPEVLSTVMQILVMIFSLIAFILSAVSLSGCHFFELSTSPSAEIMSSFWAFGGILKYDMKSGFGDEPGMWDADCRKYPDRAREWTVTQNTTYDMIPSLHQTAYLMSDGASFKAAQAMGLICTVGAGLAMITCFSMFFARLPGCVFKTLSVCYFLCFATQLMTFLVFDNEFCNGNMNNKILEVLDFDVGLTCELSTDAITAIVASFFFLALGVTILACPVPKKSVLKALCGVHCYCGDETMIHGSQISPVIEPSRNVSIPVGNTATPRTRACNPGDRRHHGNGAGNSIAI